MGPTDFAAERLRAAGNPERLDALLQQEMRLKHAAKFPWLLSAPGFRFPDALAAEQATSDALALARWQALAPHAGLRVLDMTCGLGSDAFHAARQGAHVTAIELDPAKLATAQANARALGLEGNMEFVCADSLEWLRSHPDMHFDIIFIDPARRAAGTGRRLFALADCSPSVPQALPLLLDRGRRLVVKASPMLDITQTRRELGALADIAITGTRRECKELVASLPGSGRLQVEIVADGGNGSPLVYDLTDCPAPSASGYRAPSPGLLLFEPWAPMMKAGGENWLRAQGLDKLAPDTHLYLADTLPPASAMPPLPGSFWRIDQVHPAGANAWKALKGVEAQTAVRGGFPMTAEALRQRLNAGESPSRRLYGVRDAAARKLLLLCSRAGQDLEK